MTVKELKKAIADLPDGMDVIIRQNNDEFQFSVANEARVVEVNFHDPSNKSLNADVDCFVIED